MNRLSQNHYKCPLNYTDILPSSILQRINIRSARQVKSLNAQRSNAHTGIILRTSLHVPLQVHSTLKKLSARPSTINNMWVPAWCGTKKKAVLRFNSRITLINMLRYNARSINMLHNILDQIWYAILTILPIFTVTLTEYPVRRFYKHFTASHLSLTC